MPSKTFHLLAEANKILDAAEEAGRELTETELERHAALISQARAAGAHEKALRDLGRELGPLGPVSADPSVTFAAQTPGEAFVESAGYKAIRFGANRPQQFSSGLVETGPVGLGMKGTLLEGPGGGGGALAAPVPQVAPGYVPTLFRPLVLEDLFSAAQATTNSVRYVSQGTATSGAAGVAEGGTKPESTIGFITTDEPIKKVATSIQISDEALEDAPAVQTLINNQLTSFVQLETERQLLRGTSGGNEVQGLLTSRNVPVYTAGTAQGNTAEQLFKAANSMRGSAFLEPDWFVVHPDDYQKVRLVKDTAGQFMGGGPFMGQYGSGGQANSGWLNGGPVDTLWGKPLYVSPLIGVGTALVGTRAGAQVWSRGALSVEATNSHGNNFVLNLTAIRGERRLGLAMYRATGYVEVRGLA